MLIDPMLTHVTFTVHSTFIATRQLLVMNIVNTLHPKVPLDDRQTYALRARITWRAQQLI